MRAPELRSDTTPDVTRTWDNAGRPATMTDGSGTVTYTFDNADRLTDVARTGASAGLNGTFHYGYDEAGNITGRTYPDTTVATYGFDEDGRLTSVTSSGQTTSFGYDAANNLTTVTLPAGNGHVATRTFDNAGRPTTVENKKGATVLSKFLWTLDSAGNPTKAQTTRGATDTYDAYEYDARNRLTASCFGVSAGASDCAGAANKITYAYDKVSNRTQEVRSGSVGNTGTIDYTYNAADQLTSTTKSGQTTNYAYDLNGNQASAGSRTFTYDLADRLVSTANAGTTTTYGYDGDDRRVSSTVGGSTDLRDVWDPLADPGIPELALERDPSGNLVRRYLDGPLGAVSMTNSAATFYYHHDALGTVTDVTDASGAAQWKYEYEAYGSERSATNVSGSAPENRLRFTGQYLDAETALYHLRARQYDPATGRFSALDPLERSGGEPFVSAYAYVKGQPTVLVDPLGLTEVDPYNLFSDEALNSPNEGVDYARRSQDLCWDNPSIRGRTFACQSPPSGPDFDHFKGPARPCEGLACEIFATFYPFGGTELAIARWSARGLGWCVRLGKRLSDSSRATGAFHGARAAETYVKVADVLGPAHFKYKFRIQALSAVWGGLRDTRIVQRISKWSPSIANARRWMRPLE